MLRWNIEKLFSYQKLYGSKKVGTKVWLPQAFIVGDRYVSRKTTTRRFTHASKLQRTSWGGIRHYQSTQHAYLKEVFGYIDATTLIDMMITPVLTGCTISLVQRC